MTAILLPIYKLVHNFNILFLPSFWLRKWRGRQGADENKEMDYGVSYHALPTIIKDLFVALPKEINAQLPWVKLSSQSSSPLKELALSAWSVTVDLSMLALSWKTRDPERYPQVGRYVICEPRDTLWATVLLWWGHRPDHSACLENPVFIRIMAHFLQKMIWL